MQLHLPRCNFATDWEGSVSGLLWMKSAQIWPGWGLASQKGESYRTIQASRPKNGSQAHSESGPRIGPPFEANRRLRLDVGWMVDKSYVMA